MISLMKKHWILTAVFFVATVALAAKITEDNLKLGKPGSSSDKVIEFDVGDGANNPTIVVDTTDKDFDFNKAMNIAGDLLKVGDGTNTTKEVVFDIGAGVNNPRFRWNSTESVLEFSIDGTAFKKIGSGSGAGGGINLLADFNFDFETGTPPTAWTASGGSFTAIDSGAQLYGDQSGSFDASALGQTLSSTSVSVQPGMVSRTCLAEVFYSYESGAEGDYILKIEQVDDSEASTFDLVVVDLPLTSGGSGVPAQINFDCPDDVADTLTMQIESGVADPGAIKLDNAFIGTDKNSVQVSQVGLYSKSTWPAAANCIWERTGITTTWGAFPADSDCPNPTIIGAGSIPPTKIPQMVLNNMPPGRYVVFATGTRINDSGGNTAVQGCGIIDEGGSAIASSIRSTSSGDAAPSMQTNFTGEFEVSTATNKTLNFQCFDSSNDTVSLENNFTVVGTANFSMAVYRYPLQTKEAITLETSGGDFSVYHGENCLFPRTSTTYGNFTGDPTCTYTPFRVNGAFESVVSALDSGNPQAGLVITSARQGTALICANTSVTENSFDTVLQLRLFNQTQGISIADERIRMTNDVLNRYEAATLCGLTKIVAGSNSIVLQGAASGGAQIQLQNPGGTNAISWHGFFIDQQFPTPVFTDLQNSLARRVETDISGVQSFYFELSTGTTVNQDPSGVINSVTFISGYRDEVSLNPGTFATANTWVCNCTASTSGGAGSAHSCAISVNETTPSITVERMVTTGGVTSTARLAAAAFVQCIGKP